MKTTKLVALVLAAAFAGAALGQDQTPVLDKREARQQKRISQGVASGQLNARETSRLEARETKLNADEAAAKADGKVTRKERAKLQREANRDSRHIDKQKHDAQTRK
jgi:uncharacterized membrane protein YebE (DUF533 family)